MLAKSIMTAGVLFMASVATLSLTAPATGDTTRWTTMPPNPITGVTGAAICPYMDVESGYHNCLTLECTPGEPLTLTAKVAGFDQPESLAVAIEVEGEAIWDLRLLRQEDGRYAKGMSGRQWSTGLEALQAGVSGSVTFTTEAYLWRDHLPLRGSREAIDAALDACWTARTDPARDPARAAREEVRAYCTDRLMRAAVINEGFIREEDIDGDGQADVIADYGSVNCGAIGSAWCGWAGCDLALHLNRGDDGFIAGFRGIAEGFRVVEGGVIIRRHASECGAGHENLCAVRYRATREGFVKAGVADWPAQ